MSYQITTPVHIDTVFNYFCDNCNACELSVRTEQLYDMDGNVYAQYHELTCENYQICKRLMHQLRYVKRKKE